MDIIFYCVLLFLIEIFGMMYCIKQDVHHLRLFTTLNLIIIILFASKIFCIGGLIFNYTAIPYCTIIITQLVLCKIYNKTIAQQTVQKTTFALGFFWVLANILLLSPTNLLIPNNFNILNLAVETNVISVFMAFVISQSLMLVVFEKIQNKYSNFMQFLIAIITVQTVDSLLFYTFAFYWSSPIISILNLILSGILIKICVCLMLYPLYNFIITRMTPIILIDKKTA